jgi:hypothetical protein
MKGFELFLSGEGPSTLEEITIKAFNTLEI